MSFKPYTEKIKKKKIGICSINGSETMYKSIHVKKNMQTMSANSQGEWGGLIVKVIGMLPYLPKKNTPLLVYIYIYLYLL